MNDKKLTCLRCGEKMRFLGAEKIQLGKMGWFSGNWDNLVSGALKTNIYVCPKCRKLEFYLDYENDEQPDMPEDDGYEELPEFSVIVFPKCGTVHGQDLSACPQCGYDYSE